MSFKIYQIHEYGGEWEDAFDYIIESYLSEEKAYIRKLELETEEEYVRELSKKCHSCWLHRYTEKDFNIEEYCDKYEPEKDEDDDEVYCVNEAFNYEYRYYKIAEVEVIE